MKILSEQQRQAESLLKTALYKDLMLPTYQDCIEAGVSRPELYALVWVAVAKTAFLLKANLDSVLRRLGWEVDRSKDNTLLLTDVDISDGDVSHAQIKNPLDRRLQSLLPPGTYIFFNAPEVRLALARFMDRFDVFVKNARDIYRTAASLNPDEYFYWPVDQAFEFLISGESKRELNDEAVNAAFDALDAHAMATVLIPHEGRTAQLAVAAVRRGLVPCWIKLQTRRSIGLIGIHQSSMVCLVLASMPSSALLEAFVSDGYTDEQLNEASMDYSVVSLPSGYAGFREVTQPLRSATIHSGFPVLPAVMAALDISKQDLGALMFSIAHTRIRCVFLGSQNLLSGRGDDERLRDYLFKTGCLPRLVCAVPPGLYSANQVQGCLVLFDAQHAIDRGLVRLVSMKSKNLWTALPPFFRTLRISELLSENNADGFSCLEVEPAQISPPDFSWLPAKYLSISDFEDEGRLLLEDVVEIVRAPTFSKIQTGEEVTEIGIPELGKYSPMGGQSKKTTLLEPGKSAERLKLRDGDVVLSVKGTIGKTGFFGLDAGGAQRRDAVCSNSCVALRARARSGLSPTVVFMYLQTSDFQRQVEGLSSGAVINVLNLSSLKMLKIPRRLLDDEGLISRLSDAWHRLCELELAQTRIADEMAEVLSGQVQL